MTEIVLNPDGKLWLTNNKEAAIAVDHMPKEDALTFVHALAQFSQQY